jgi:diaminohydroxyphosphoribosylaminopyrimidine deaminase / 5-amino-6-(5-phosphoribosylamino)uracil reductase
MSAGMEPLNKYMKRAITLAKRGTGWVNPNPLVGAVLLKGDKIIGEGYHEYFGGPHAEVNAIMNAKEDPSGATLFVTLEPCVHEGKTPPCSDLIVNKGISKVIIGVLDPNPLVNGKGKKFLEDHGIEVNAGFLEKEIVGMNEPFFKFIQTGKPFCVLKTAMTLDGKIATVGKDSHWISGKESRKLIHELRQQLSAIMVGINTVVIDDPMLNTRREGKKNKNPLKVVVDTASRLSLESNVLTNDPQLTLIATSSKADSAKLKQFERLGAQVLVCPLKNEQVDLSFLVDSLGTMGIDSILLEGGSTIAFSALREGIVDKVISFIAPKIVGGAKANSPVGGEGIKMLKDAILLRDLDVKRVGEDIMVQGYING